MTTTHSNVGIYARYSCDQQRETSIDDQITRCMDVAARHGLTVDPQLIFNDSALSGTGRDTHKRTGYHEMLAQLDAGTLNVLIVDEFSRLSRDAVDQAYLIRRFDQNKRVRMLTADGIDTAQANWQLQVGLIGIVAQQSSRDTKHRVVRGMIGQLERGYMIATPPYGYTLKRELDAQGNRIGSHWEIHDEHAAIVREVFERRGDGQSMHQIARWLNESGVKTSRKAKIEGGGYWRAARIKIMLSNPIYQGEFIWNASRTVKDRVKKSGETLTERVFPRPHLRLVSDELWHRCNNKFISRSGYGGGKHAFAGLIQCGYCNSTLVLSSRSRCRSVYCASCTSAKSMKSDEQAQTSTVAVEGIQVLLEAAMKKFLTPRFVNAFRVRLRDQLSGDMAGEIADLTADATRWAKIQERLSHLLMSGEDPMLFTRYQEAKKRYDASNAKLENMSARMVGIDHKALEAQIQIHPLPLLKRLFNSEIAPEQLRSVLVRLFPEIVFEGKNGRYTSFFKIRFSVASAHAIATETDQITDMALEKRYCLRYVRVPMNASRSCWTVEEIPFDDPNHALKPHLIQSQIQVEIDPAPSHFPLSQKSSAQHESRGQVYS